MLSICHCEAFLMHRNDCGNINDFGLTVISEGTARPPINN